MMHTNHLPISAPWWISVFAIVAMITTAAHSVSSIQWYPCNLYTNNNNNLNSVKYTTKDNDGISTIQQAECAIMPTPLNHDDPNSAKINLFLKRLRPEAQMVQSEHFQKKASKVVYVLGGGSGVSEPMETLMERLFTYFDGDFQVYTLDQRGSGRSKRLSCLGPQAETSGSDGGVRITSHEYPACIEELKEQHDTSLYSVTQSAQDLASVIRETKEDMEVYMYGNGYGTFWIERFMQMDTENVTKGIILDGVYSQVASSNENEKGRTRFDQYDLDTNAAGIELINLCVDDEYCGGKISSQYKGEKVNGEKFVRDTFARLYDNGTCTDFTMRVPAARLRRTLKRMLGSQLNRNIIPALLYRLHRCNIDKDLEALAYFIDTLDSLEDDLPSCTPLGSEMLKFNLLFSEMWSTVSPTPPELEQIFNSTFFAQGMMDIAPIREQWPLYVPDERYHGKTFKTESTSVLMLNGNLDPDTSLSNAKVQFEAIQAPLKYLVSIPFASHFTAFSSPVHDSNMDCGLQIMLSFLRDSDKVPDTTCLSNLVSPDWRGNPATGKLSFGTKDVWDGAYYPPENNATVDLYVFIGVVGGVVMLSLVIICSLLYFIVRERDNRVAKLARYQNLDDSIN